MCSTVRIAQSPTRSKNINEYWAVLNNRGCTNTNGQLHPLYQPAIPLLYTFVFEIWWLTSQKAIIVEQSYPVTPVITSVPSTNSRRKAPPVAGQPHAPGICGAALRATRMHGHRSAGSSTLHGAPHGSLWLLPALHAVAAGRCGGLFPPGSFEDCDRKSKGEF